MRLLHRKDLEIKSSKSVLSFQTTGGGSWKVWDRFIEIDGKKAFHIGNICGTCNFFFERLDGANQKVSQKETIEQLSKSPVAIESDTYYEIEKLIPVGKYVVMQLQAVPKQVTLGTSEDYFVNEETETWGIDGFWGLPHNPRIPYYRGRSIEINDRSIIHSFLIPIVPINWLDDDTVEKYKSKMVEGVVPTVICLSYFDVKEPADWDNNQKHTQHNCFANIVLDGHHKLLAAASTGKPINVISFLSLDNSIASRDDVDRLEKYLKNGI